jgi:hypothetical protein
MKATLFSSNGVQSEIELTSFSHAQSLVGGLVQILNKGSNTLLFNEEGLVLDLPANPFFPFLTGNVLVVNPKQFNSLPYMD